MNFLERAKRLGHLTNEKTLQDGITTTIMVKSLQELKELLNYESLEYNNFSTDESTNDISPEAKLIHKIYQYVFGGEDQLAPNDLDMLDKMFPIPVEATTQENKTIDKVWIISGIPQIHNYNTLTIKKGGYINVIDTEFNLQVDNINIEGTAPTGNSIINILGRDGTNGQNGANGHDGYNGPNGADDTIAHHGGLGGNGTDATNGTPGYSGTGHKKTIIEISTEIKGTLTIRTQSGNGGNGGNGGKGGNGGHGGHGGNVHVGLCEDRTGGNGGNGGFGGKGGDGGNGGNGGNSLNVPVIITVPSAFKNNVETKKVTPNGGQAGTGGSGGVHGNGAEGGYGNCRAGRGTHGKDGENGYDGREGKNGDSGTSSEIIVKIS